MMNDDINVRLGKMEDLSSILSLNISEYYRDLSIWQEHTQRERWELSSWWGDIDLLNWHFEVLKSSNGGIIVAIHGDKIIGELDYITSHDFDGDAPIQRYHIIWIIVDKDYRRKGVAHTLIRYLQNISQGAPIWVEAEDDRTENLYNAMGTKKLHLTNWISKNNMNNIGTSIPHKINSVNNEYLLDIVKSGEWKVLIGNYYAPEFDINQLIRAEKVQEYIWGELPPADIIEYKLENIHVIAVLTQYPRILVKSGYKLLDFIDILSDILIRIHNIGFEEIYIQYYLDDRIEEILSKLNLISQGNKDVVYEL